MSTDVLQAAITVPFTVVVDTREQQPYEFAGLVADTRQRRRPLVVPIVHRAIPAGDYSIHGYDLAGVSVERKSLTDLYGTLGQSRARFVRELERMLGFDRAAVVVEAEWSAVLTAPTAGLVRSELNSKTIYRSVVAWQQRYPSVHWWFVPGRQVAEVTVFRILERFWLDKQRAAG